MGTARRTTYRRRPIRCQELWEDAGWRIKVYGIAADGPAPSDELVAAAKRTAQRALPQPPEAAGRYGVGFLTVHAGADAGWVLLDWWADDNQLHHLVFRSDHDRPADLTPVTGGLIACTWELAVIEFERAAWVSEVFQADSPDLDRYLAARLDTQL